MPEYDILDSFEGLSVGDVLIVRPDLYHNLGRIGVTSKMIEFAGNAVTIKNFNKPEWDQNFRYPTIMINEIDDSVLSFYWTPDLFLAERPVGDIDPVMLDDLFCEEI